MSGGPGLESLVDQTISVITNDGRNIVGILKGFDQATNLILDESHERVYSTKEGVQQLVLGLYIIRGDNMYVNQLLSQLHLLIPHIKTKPPSHPLAFDK
nr:sm-like protein LSM8 [Ipomoea batatas]GMC98964.1 sm-like protein LSM8 [Ipomoea batatas]